MIERRVLFVDCDGVIGVNSEEIAMPIAAIVLNDAMKELVGDAAPQFDLATFTQEYAGGHFSQFYAMAAKMLEPHGKSLPPIEVMDEIKLSRTVEALRRNVYPAADFAPAMKYLMNMGFIPAAVSSSEIVRVKPCIEKVQGHERIFGDRIYSAADDMLRVFGRKIPKPEPDIGLHVARQLGVYAKRGTHGLAIEDSSSGVKCWVAAGIPVVGYVGGTHINDKKAHAESLMDLGAVAVFETFEALSRYVASNYLRQSYPKQRFTLKG